MSIKRFASLCVISALSVYLFHTANATTTEDSPAPDAGQDEIEEIVVTGSRIKRRDFISASPLSTLDREDIAFSGQSTLEVALNQMPQVSPSFGRASNNPGTGTSHVDLRGMGASRTLTLLNGRRLGGTYTGNAVDLNNIPQFLVERVEVITGGTSAVYGSDAIAGVVNFITKENFSGFGVEATMSMAEPGDAEAYDFNVAYGQDFADGRGNFMVFANYYDRKPLFAGDREFTSVPYFDDWEGNLVESGSSLVPEGVIFWPYADLGNGPVELTFNADGTPREYDWGNDRYNYAPVNYLQVPLTRHSLGLFGHFDFSDELQAYLELNVSRNEPKLNLAAVPAQLAVGINLDSPVLTSEARQVFTDYYSCEENLACVILGKRLLEVGPRYSSSEADFARVVAGVRGDIWDDWSFDAWIVYADQSYENLLLNAASRSRLQQGLLVDPATGECYDPSGGCVSLNLFGEGNLSQEGADFIRVPPLHNTSDRTDKMVSVLITGSPMNTWAGPVDAAFGVEWRDADANYIPDSSIDLNDTLAWDPGVGVDGSDEVIEAYAEAIIPLAQDATWARYLGLEVGGRYSDYEHADGFWTYKAGAEWRPVDSVRLRTMQQHSVRAPTIDDLFYEQWVYTWTIDYDPCTASAEPIENGNLEKCILQGLPEDQVGVFEATERYPVDFIDGGNQNLKPETGDTWTAGVVLTPSFLSSLTVSVDYFEMKLEDTIGWIDSMLICFDAVNTGNEFCQNIARDETGNVANVTDLTSNRGILETTGVDTQFDYRAELPDFFSMGGYAADIAINLYWTHLLSYKVQENIVTQIRDCAGYYGWPCWSADESDTFSHNRVTTNVHYSAGPLSTHLTWRWIEGSNNAAPLASADYGVPDPILAVPSVGDEQYVDLGLSYEFSDAFVVRFGISNLLDNDPPQMADQQWSNNTDTGIYDVFGRSYYLTVSTHLD